MWRADLQVAELFTHRTGKDALECFDGIQVRGTMDIQSCPLNLFTDQKCLTEQKCLKAK